MPPGSSTPFTWLSARPRPGGGLACWSAATRGATLVAQADAWMRGQEVREPGRMTEVYAPGFNRRAGTAVIAGPALEFGLV